MEASSSFFLLVWKFFLKLYTMKSHLIQTLSLETSVGVAIGVEKIIFKHFMVFPVLK